jgi:hypothetical protein
MESAAGTRTPDRTKGRPGNGDAGGERDDPRLSYAILTVVLLGAAWLRLHDLDRTSLWLDEAISWSQSRGSLLHLVQATAVDNYPPLHNLVLWVTIALLGDGESALRLPSALFGIANVYALYRLGAVLWDRTTGLFAAILLSFSIVHIWYSQEARMYALLALTSTLFVLGAVRSVLEPSRRRIALASLAGVLLLYSHVYGAFVWASVDVAILLWLTLRPPGGCVDWRVWLIPQAIAAAAFLPWAIVLSQRATAAGNLSFIPETTAYFVLYQLWLLASGQAGLMALCALTLLAFVQRNRQRGGANATHAPGSRPMISLECDWRHGLLLTWLMAPALIGCGISIVAYPILVFRYLLCSLPAFHLLAARGLQTLAPNAAVAGVLMLAVVAASFETGLESDAAGLKLNDRFAMVREDYRGAAAIFAKEFKPSDRVIFLAGEILTPFQYYFREPFEYRQAWSSSQVPDDALTGRERLWVIASHIDERELAALLHRIAARRPEAGRRQLFGIGKFLFSGAQSGHSGPDNP